MARTVTVIVLFLLGLARPVLALGPVFGWQRPLNTDARFDQTTSAFREDWAPRIATDRHGVWLTVWQADYGVIPYPGDDPRTEADILVARSTNAGWTWTMPAPVNTDAAADARFDLWPTVANDGAGTWIATWQTRRTFAFEPGEDLGDVYAARSTDDGTTWSTPIPISVSPTQHDFSPVVTAAMPGTFVIAWMGYETTPQGDHEIFFARSTDGGTTWSAPATLNSDAASDGEPYGKNDTYPSLASDGAGTVIASWGGQTTTLPWHIAVARSTDGGATWSDPVHIESPEPRGNDMPDIAYDGAGTWMIAWSSFEGEYQNRRLRLARSTDAGESWTLVPASDIDGTLGGTYVFRTRIAGEPAGNWVVSWEAHSIFGPDTDIFMIQSFDGGITWKAPRYLNSLAAIENDGNDYAASLATDRAGGWLAVWTAAPGYYQTGSAHPALIDTGSEGDIFVARGRFVSCDPAPRASCTTPDGSSGARLVVKKDAVSQTGALAWTWSGATTPEGFGDPLTERFDLVLCFYDGNALVSEALVPAIGACGAEPCWQDNGTQLKYRDRDRIPSGVERIGIKAGKLTLKGSGRALPLPPMPASLPLVVQLQATNGHCLAAAYGTADVRKNDSRVLKGKGR
ncbi:MAG: sialidase family protein [Candidatus Binatia bacterium]